MSKYFQGNDSSITKKFSLIEKIGFETFSAKCKVLTTQIDYSGSTITGKGTTPTYAKAEKLFGHFRMLNKVNEVKRLNGYVLFFRNFIPNLGQKLLQFQNFSRKENASRIKIEHH